MIEFPKCLYRNVDFSGDTLTVSNADEQSSAAKDGWLTCEQIYGLEPMPEPPAPPVDPPLPEDPVVVEEAPGVSSDEKPAPKKKAKK